MQRAAVPRCAIHDVAAAVAAAPDAPDARDATDAVTRRRSWSAPTFQRAIDVDLVKTSLSTSSASK
jgi:hypothetical protein